MASPISSTLRECLQEFNTLVTRFQWKSQSSLVNWKDELGRLRVWSANVGAHQVGTSSLEYRLRDASHIRDQVIDLLLGLKKVLGEIGEELSTAEEEHEDWGEIDDLLRSVREIVQCLFEMAMLIRKPARHDRTLHFDRGDIRDYEDYDKRHVREKFPRLSSSLIDRLALANSYRRQYFKYRERHKAKLAKGLDDDAATQDLSAPLSDTVATELVESGILPDDTKSLTDLSQTSYAPSLDSGSGLTVPAVPSESKGASPFECPYCFYVISIRNRKEWIKHVFQDLQPYVCIWDDCALSQKCWDSRKEWSKHIATHGEASMGSSTERSVRSECPLCFDIHQTEKFERYVGRHLEDLALWVLPSTLGEADDDLSREHDGSSSIDETDDIDDAPDPGKKAPITFKDAIGRKYQFPFEMCCKWSNMEELIRQAFMNIDGLSQHVYDGHYDLSGLAGEIILKDFWESTVKPGWTITMHLWSVPDPELAKGDTSAALKAASMADAGPKAPKKEGSETKPDLNSNSPMDDVDEPIGITHVSSASSPASPYRGPSVAYADPDNARRDPMSSEKGHVYISGRKTIYHKDSGRDMEERPSEEQLHHRLERLESVVRELAAPNHEPSSPGDSERERRDREMEEPHREEGLSHWLERLERLAKELERQDHEPSPPENSDRERRDREMEEPQREAKSRHRGEGSDRRESELDRQDERKTASLLDGPDRLSTDADVSEHRDL